MGRPTVPWMLRVVFVAVGVQAVVDAVAIGLAPSATEIAIGALGLALDLVLFLGLMRGSEAVRRLLRAAAGVGLVVDAFQAVRWIVTARAGEGGLATGMLAGALLAGSAFVFWALGHAHVQRWVFDRWLARQ